MHGRNIAAMRLGPQRPWKQAGRTTRAEPLSRCVGVSALPGRFRGEAALELVDQLPGIGAGVGAGEEPFCCLVVEALPRLLLAPGEDGVEEHAVLARRSQITERVAGMRVLPVGIDQRSACRHPDWTGPDDLQIKIEEIREITDWEKPIYVKVGASRPYYDTALAVKAGADVVVLDGMQGGTAATQEVFIENVGLPILSAIRPAVQALIDLGLHRKVQLIVSGGVRNGADVAKALALGADAVSIGTAALVALGDNDPALEDEYAKLGTTAGAYDDWHEGRDPAGITTQDPALMRRLDPVKAGRRLANYLSVMTLEAQTIARACGKSHVHNLEPEDLVALTIEAAAMARVPLAGTGWIPGGGGI